MGGHGIHEIAINNTKDRGLVRWNRMLAENGIPANGFQRAENCLDRSTGGLEPAVIKYLRKEDGASTLRQKTWFAVWYGQREGKFHKKQMDS